MRKIVNNFIFVFNPESWKKDREKGLFRFMFVPILVVFIFTLGVIYVQEPELRKYPLLVAILTIATSSMMFVVRATTWYWKEYKYNRYINNITSLNKYDYLIILANIVRIIIAFILAYGCFYIAFHNYDLGFL